MTPKPSTAPEKIEKSESIAKTNHSDADIKEFGELYPYIAPEERTEILDAIDELAKMKNKYEKTPEDKKLLETISYLGFQLNEILTSPAMPKSEYDI